MANELKNLFNNFYVELEESDGMTPRRVCSMINDFGHHDRTFKIKCYQKDENGLFLTADVIMKPEEARKILIEKIKKDEGKDVMFSEPKDVMKVW